MSDPSKFLHLLTHLNRAPTKFGKAPHKSVLLITLLELMEHSSFTTISLSINTSLLSALSFALKNSSCSSFVASSLSKNLRK